jgi:hypothetical protein
MAETELKVTQALEKPFTITIFPSMDSWCLVPFSSNIYWDCKNKSISCFDYGNYILFTGREWGQAGYTARKF